MLNHLHRYRLLKRALLTCCLGWLGLLLALAIPALATAPFHWEFINVDLDVQSNGDMLVTETQKYVFTSPHTNQRYRYIPLDKVDDIKDVEVFEGETQLNEAVGRENNQLWVSWQHELNAPEDHTFTLKYRVVGGLQVDPQTTQIYWKAIFPDRSAPIEAAKVRVHFPEAVAGQADFISFGAPATAQAIDEQTFEFIAQDKILPQQELEVQVAFPSQLLAVPQPQWQQQQTNQPSQQPQPDLTSRIITDKGNPQSAWVHLFWLLPIGGFWAMFTLSRRCPKCGRFTLQRNSRTTQAATYISSGSERVTHHCDRCDYHRSFSRTIPKKSTSTSVGAAGGYTGGGFSGGGSSGGGGFGGGGSGGGGGGGGGGG
ncbi:MAG: DUF2207 domain-containing protein [Cyanobacteria bacterium J06635_15]